MNYSETYYDHVAHEYHNSARHPTCANFDKLSRKFLEPKISTISNSVKRTIDVGAGRSVLASVLAKLGLVSTTVFCWILRPACLSILESGKSLVRA